MKERKLVVIYFEDLSGLTIEKVHEIIAKTMRKELPNLRFLFTNKKLESLSLEEILPWLKRLVKEAEA